MCFCNFILLSSVFSGEDDEDDYGPEERTCKSLTNSPHRKRAGGVILRQKSDISDAFTPRSSPSTRRRSASFKRVQKYKKQEAREEKVLEESFYM